VLEQLVAFLPALVVTTVTPGLNSVLVLRTAMASGPRAGAAAAAGASVGIVAWSSAAAFGVGALVLTLPGGLDGVRVAGGILMLVLGLWGLVPHRPLPVPEAGRGFTTGLAVCLANPRTPVGALSLLPQYAVADAVTTSTVVLGVTWAFAAGTWNLLCVGAVARGRLGPSASRTLQRLGALALIGLGSWGLLGVATT
jgi:threonine/homoserine/homoserine lactone efflux protein